MHENYKSPMILVTCGIILKGNEILVTQRSELMKLPLKWEFPGGKINPDETEEECLKRELKEELNIEIEILKKMVPNIHNYPSFVIKLIPFLVKYVSGEIILLEHVTYKWVYKNDMDNLDWAEADLPIVEQIKKLEI